MGCVSATEGTRRMTRSRRRYRNVGALAVTGAADLMVAAGTAGAVPFGADLNGGPGKKDRNRGGAGKDVCRRGSLVAC